MKARILKIKDARNIILQAQRLQGAGQLSTMKIIQELGHVQIDTISVVQRAHHHTLWSRNENYQLAELDGLLAQRKIFEYWSHAASYLPMDSYRFCLPRMHRYKTGKNHWFNIDKKMKQHVLDQIKAEGPQKAADFKSNKKHSGWFDWNPAKKALEQHFMEGTLMATRRDSFHKVYDFKENVLPSHVDTTFPTARESSEFLIKNQLGHLGLATLDEMAYQRGPEVKAQIKKFLGEMLDEGKLLQVSLENHSLPYYIFPRSLEPVKKGGKEIHILSPFDNMVIQRKRLEKLFDFNYQVECYVPENKRKYGYFCLPVLQGDKFIARMDAKANRQTGTFEIRKFFYEDATSSKKLNRPLKMKIAQFAAFNLCKKIEWGPLGEQT